MSLEPDRCVKASLLEQGGEVHGLIAAFLVVVVPQGDVHRGLAVGHGGQGVVQANGAGGDADGQQQEDAHHRLGQIGGVDLAEPLAQGKDVQVFVIHPRVALDKLHHKAGQGPEDEQGARRTQPQHGETQKGDRHRQGHAEGEQNGIGPSQTNHAGRQLDHRRHQGPGLEHLVLPLSVNQVDELGAGYPDPAEQHDQQENNTKVEHCLSRRLGGEVHRQQSGYVHLKHGQGEGGHAEAGQHPQSKPGGQGNQAHNARLQEEQAGHLPLAQAKKQIGAQLPLPAAEEKAVGVQNEAGQHHRHKDGKDVDNHHNGVHHRIFALGKVDNGSLALDGVEGIEQAHTEGEGEQVDAVVPEGPAHVAQGQLREHRPSLLPSG